MINHNDQAVEALEKIMNYILMVPAEVSHHAANMDSDEDCQSYGLAIVEQLEHAANLIRDDFGFSE